MFERFTERARRVMSLSRQEAQRLNCEFIGTEHILLGIIAEGGGIAAKVLKNLDVDPKRVRVEIEKLVTPSTPPPLTLGQLPFSPRSKRVIELAGEEACQLGHDVIGTEHLLLAILKHGDGLAAQVLINFGMKLDEVRDLTLEVLGAPAAATPAPPPPSGKEAKEAKEADVSEMLEKLIEKDLPNLVKIIELRKQVDTRDGESALSSLDKAKMVVDAWLARGGQEKIPNHTEYLTQMIAWAIEASRRGA